MNNSRHGINEQSLNLHVVSGKHVAQIYIKPLIAGISHISSYSITFIWRTYLFRQMQCCHCEHYYNINACVKALDLIKKRSLKKSWDWFLKECQHQFIAIFAAVKILKQGSWWLYNREKTSGIRESLRCINPQYTRAKSCISNLDYQIRIRNQSKSDHVCSVRASISNPIPEAIQTYHAS